MANKKKKEIGLLIILVVAVLAMTVGFAAYSTTLNINGSVTVKGSPWKVHYDATTGVTRTTGSQVPTVEKIDTNDTNFQFTVTLTKPGDFYEATIKAWNEGTIDAILKSVTMSTLTAAQQKYLSYTVTYGTATYTETKTGLTDTLSAGAKKDVKVRVEYLKPTNQSDLPTEDVTVTVTGALLYESE